MRLLIIRHAEPDYPNNTLTEKGFREAECLAKHIERYHIDEIYCSPMNRALFTAEAIERQIHVPITVMDWMREFSYPFYGKPDGQKSVCWDWLPVDWANDPAYLSTKETMESPAFKESVIPEKYREITGELDALLKDHGYVREGGLYRAVEPNRKTIALVCHFGLESVLLSHILNIPPMLLWQGTCAAPTSVTSVYTEERREGYAYFRMNQYGETTHLLLENEPVSFHARFCETFDSPDEPKDD